MWSESPSSLILPNSTTFRHHGHCPISVTLSSPPLLYLTSRTSSRDMNADWTSSYFPTLYTHAYQVLCSSPHIRNVQVTLTSTSKIQNIFPGYEYRMNILLISYSLCACLLDIISRVVLFWHPWFVILTPLILNTSISHYLNVVRSYLKFNILFSRDNYRLWED